MSLRVNEGGSSDKIGKGSAPRTQREKLSNGEVFLFEYDESGKTVAKKHYDKDGKIVEAKDITSNGDQYCYEYGKDGKVTKKWIEENEK